MNKFTVLMAFALATVIVAEPPSQQYGVPNSGGGGQVFQLVSGGGSDFSAAEGEKIATPELLEQIRQILLQEESKSGGGSSGHGGSGGVSSSYGPPAPVYGAPAARIVGIQLDGIRPGIQIASFSQQSQEQSSAPSSSYGPPQRTGGGYY